MKNPVVAFLLRMIICFALIIGLFKLGGVQDLSKKAFRSVASVKWSWLGAEGPIRFVPHDLKNALNDDTVIVNPPNGGRKYLINTQKYSLRFFVLLFVLIVAIPGAWRPKLKQIFWAFVLFYLFVTLKQFISIFYIAQINDWPMNIGLPGFISKNLGLMERVIVMSSHANLMLVFAIWVLVCFGSIREQFLPSV